MADFKSKILFSSKNGKIKAMAKLLGDKYNVVPDVIPPAYNCENERIVFIFVTLGSKGPSDAVRLFCRGLTKQRAHNVALYVDGTPESAKVLIEALQDAGTKIYEEIKYKNLKFSLFPKITDEEKAEISEWADKIVGGIIRS